MIMNIKKITMIMLLAFVALLPFSVAEAIDPAATETLEKMPAPNVQVARELNSRLVKAGPEVISQICDLIVAPGTGDDTNARFALAGLCSYVTRPGADAEQKMYSDVLVKALTKATDDEVKSFFISQLQLAGTVEAIPALSAYLSSERLCERASMALQTIGTDAAAKAVLKALPGASQKNLPTIIYALGQMRSKDAVEDISRYVASEDRGLGLIALAALAEIGDRSSIKILKNALDVKNPYDKALIASYNLTLAQRLNQSGRIGDAIGICKDILKRKSPGINSGAKASALSVLVDTLGVKSLDYLLSAFDDGDAQVQGAAMNLVATIEGWSITKKFGRKLITSSPGKQIKIAEMLGNRGDKAALDALRKTYAGSEVVEVKIAALKSIVQLDKVDALGDLIDAFKSDQEAVSKTAMSLVMLLPTKEFADTAIKSLPNLSANGQIALIKILADRRVSESFDAVFALTSSEDSSVCVAAIRALAKLAGPDDLTKIIGIMLNGESELHQSEASRVVRRLCSTRNSDAMSAGPLLAAVKGAKAQQQISIIKILPSVGTKPAFEIVKNNIKNSDAKLKDAAIRALAKWPNTR